MPKPDEVQAVLDVLWLSKNINWDFEQRMWSEAARKLDYTITDKLKRRRPKRYAPGWAKNECDKAFRELMTFALKQAELIRRGKKLEDIYPLTANVVEIQSDHYGVELYLGHAGTHFMDGFKDWHAAKRWADYSSRSFLREKGVPDDKNLIVVGECYY